MSSRMSFDMVGPSTDILGLASPEILARREAKAAKAKRILNFAWEPSTKETYERSLRVFVHGAEIDVSTELLPIDTNDYFTFLFADMEGMSWATVRINQSAVKAWHVAHGFLKCFKKN